MGMLNITKKYSLNENKVIIHIILYEISLYNIKTNIWTNITICQDHQLHNITINKLE